MVCQPRRSSGGSWDNVGLSQTRRGESITPKARCYRSILQNRKNTMRKHLFPLLASLLLWACTPDTAQAYTNLADAYAAMGFNPSASSNAVVVLFSDPHISLHLNESWFTTNLDARLVNNINAMVPPPAKIVVAGDETTTYSGAPGQMPPCCEQQTLATNEMLCWLSVIQGFTNIAQTNILWVPGNHDQDPRETNAEIFCSIFTNMPPRQSFDLAGVRFFLLNGGNLGVASDIDKLWLKEQLAHTSPTQTIATVIHQPPFNTGRGWAVTLRDFFRDWQVRWWDFSGHAHAFSQKAREAITAAGGTAELIVTASAEVASA